MQTLLERNGMIGIETEIEGLEKTWTASVYREPLKTYEPLSNGFNKELATAVLDRITARQKQWDQRMWRNIAMRRPADGWVKARMLKGLAFEQNNRTTVCHTTMCFAGWVAELTHADWVVDGSLVKEAAYRGTPQVVTVGGHRVGVDAYAELVVVDKANFSRGSGFRNAALPSRFRNLPSSLHQNLLDRGFSEGTHGVGSVPMVARAALGLNGIESDNLFSSHRGLEGIKGGIEYFSSCSRRELANL